MQFVSISGFFLYHRIRPSVSVFFLKVASTYVHVMRTAKNPKIGKIGAKIRASIYKKPRSPYFFKNVAKS